tara:strand:+ start:1710 stop:2078 length:369 start_codon:yes stop_codon:yes gene_type:complete
MPGVGNWACGGRSLLYVILSALMPPAAFSWRMAAVLAIETGIMDLAACCLQACDHTSGVIWGEVNRMSEPSGAHPTQIAVWSHKETQPKGQVSRSNVITLNFGVITNAILRSLFAFFCSLAP